MSKVWMRVMWLMALVALGAGVGGATAAPEGVSPEHCPPALRSAVADVGDHITCGLVRTPLNPSDPSGEQVLIWTTAYFPQKATRPPVVLIPGGPGQAASPMLGGAISMLSERFPDRPVVLFDPRGTGRSSRIHCPEFFSTRMLSPQEQTERGTSCALRLGPRRAFFTAHETVADLEAIRNALKIARWMPVGVSWGTVAATRYVREYPGSLDRVIIDSTLPAGEPELSERLGGVALDRIIREACSTGCPAGADLVAALTQLSDETADGASVLLPDSRGRMRPVTVGRDVPQLMIYLGDMMPGVRESLLAPLALSWYRGDRVPMAMLVRALMRDGGGTPPDEGDSTTVFYTTACEEGFGWPWSDATPLGERPGLARLAGIAGLAAGSTPVDVCRGWPRAAAAGERGGDLPQVPMLILSGSRDLRTPTEGAQELKARAPWARLLVVEGEGHSVITANNDCMIDHIKAFSDDAPAPDCQPRSKHSVVSQAWPRTVADLPRIAGATPGMRQAAAMVNYLGLAGSPLVPWEGARGVWRAPGLRSGSLTLNERAGRVHVKGVRILEGPALSGTSSGATARYRAGGEVIDVANVLDTLSARAIPMGVAAVLQVRGREWAVRLGEDEAPGREDLQPVAPQSCQGFDQVRAAGILSGAVSSVAYQMLTRRTPLGGAALARAGREGAQVENMARGVRISVPAGRRFAVSISPPIWTGRERSSADIRGVVCGEPVLGSIERAGDVVLITL